MADVTPSVSYKLVFDGVGAAKLSHNPKMVQELTRMLAYGNRSTRRRADAYLRKQQVSARIVKVAG